MTNAAFVDRLVNGIGVEYPPIGLARVPERPAGIDMWTDAVPSACTFWRRAEHATFFASADAHMGCPIGAMVMGLDLSENKQDELMTLVGDMCAIEYLDESEVPNIPHFDSPAAGVVYGPVESFPIPPDLVMVWATPRQAMLLEEVLGVSVWDGQTGQVLGRPACAALPAAVAAGDAVVSLGCAGMRTFTEIPDDRLLLVIPAAKLDGLAGEVTATLDVNEHMTGRYQEMKRGV